MFDHIKSSCIWQRLYPVVDVNVETHCTRLSVVSTFSLRTAVSRHMQCVSTKLFKFLKKRVNTHHEGKMGNPYDRGMAHIMGPCA
ncbi:hypothetical protein KsCSTR_34270 [Candidatus Kuenenia stuttgartiensis]|uniref:Uncharacterized protein n=1 Tax=Kuenenia stuttgartiensis TaxID=174633 RepID=Q1Q469_KUEST|nr:hypothetical protein KsCSTR_34270 [Candidatus Kuenenia stuttgartiensis]CAJ74815.1 unknown protein [Candidatus Kuenenia stuttgartiensis]